MYFLDFSKCTKNKQRGGGCKYFVCSSLVKWSNLTCAYFQMEWFNHQPVIWWNKWFKPNVGKFKPNVGKFKPNVGSHIPVLWSIWEMNTNNKQDHSRTIPELSLLFWMPPLWHPDILISQRCAFKASDREDLQKLPVPGSCFFFFRQYSRMEGKISRCSREFYYILDAFGDEDLI